MMIVLPDQAKAEEITSEEIYDLTNRYVNTGAFQYLEILEKIEKGEATAEMAEELEKWLDANNC